MNRLCTWTCVFAGLIVSGCAQIASSEVSQSAIFAEYSASYNDETNQLSFSATFSVSGSTGTSVMLDGGSSVSLDGLILPSSTDLFGQYIYSFTETASPTDVLASHVFIYTDNHGQAYTNRVTIPLDIAIDTAPGTMIPVTLPFVAHWSSTDSLLSSDEVQLTLQKSDDTASTIGEDYGTSDTAGKVVFPPNQLEPLGNGNFRLVACRNQWLPVQDAPEAGGNISVSRCLPEIDVTLH